MTDPADTVPSSDGGAHQTEAYCPECGQSFPPDHVRCPNDAARLVKLGGPADPLIGRVFEQRYEVRSRLGEGGMGAVYRGWQLSVDREVAIKVIDPRLSGDRGVVKRFLREARLSSRLNQPSIVNVYDFGQTEDGILYIVMELLRGHTLGSELTRHHALGIQRTVHIAVQLCDALDAAHKQDIVHRDLKPGNVMILDDPPGRDLVKVLDFGLAKSLGREAMSNLTHSDALLGTPLYMSPEQIAGQPTDQRVDLYALGCMMHEMVTGTPAFGGASIDRVLSNHLYELAAPLPADVPPALVELIRRLIAKHPGDRPQSAAEVRRALLGEVGPSSLFAGTTVVGQASSPVVAPVRPPATLPPSSLDRLPRSRRWWIGIVAVVAGATMAAAIAISWQSRRPPTKAPAALLDAGMPPADASADAGIAPLDAGLTLDAAAAPLRRDAGATVLPIDAGRPASRPPRRPPPSRPEIDAGSELDFYRSDAGP
jgi:hypothetical protein